MEWPLFRSTLEQLKNCVVVASAPFPDPAALCEVRDWLDTSYTRRHTAFRVRYETSLARAHASAVELELIHRHPPRELHSTAFVAEWPNFSLRCFKTSLRAFLDHTPAEPVQVPYEAVECVDTVLVYVEAVLMHLYRCERNARDFLSERYNRVRELNDDPSSSSSSSASSTHALTATEKRALKNAENFLDRHAALSYEQALTATRLRWALSDGILRLAPPVESIDSSACGGEISDNDDGAEVASSFDFAQLSPRTRHRYFQHEYVA